MFRVLKKWFESYLADEEAITLLLIIFVGLAVVIYAGNIVGPIIASIIIAYLLQGLVGRLQRLMPYSVSLSLTYSFFIGLCLLLVLVALPLIVKQLSALAVELPRLLPKLQAMLVQLQKDYPQLLSHEQMQSLVKLLTERAAGFAQQVVSFSFSSIGNVFTLMVYAVLIPIMVFFFLRDRQQILDWLGGFLPESRPMMQKVWHEMNVQVAGYARGKALEVFLVGTVSFIAFSLLGLNYAALLGFLVGLSVIVPYIGATVVTLPVMLVAFFQFGYSAAFAYVMAAYAVIQFIDGNVLVPVLFSEAVNMHPLAIIVAVLVFGGFWGVWGVFFAIPLATLIKALLSAWPSAIAETATEQESVS